MRYASLAAGLLSCGMALMDCAPPAALYNLLPPVYEYRSYLVPGSGTGETPGYAANDDGSIAFNQGGLQVMVRPLSDAELNRRYADVSYRDRFSANPFTFGNWRDPELGYTPTRFTVFEVEVFNPVLPKVELFPDRVQLRTDRGDELAYYAINREESANSFEDYYTLIRGPGGNEQYRFDQRMGIVREELYRPDHQVFKGGDYKGYLVFETLDEEVRQVELHIRGFATQFDEANHPRQTQDLVFQFDRRVEKRELRGEEARKARQRDWILTGAAQR